MSGEVEAVKELSSGYELKMATMIPPAGYKRTEAGIIPNDWKDHAIRDVSRLINGRGFKPFEWRLTGLPIIRIQNLNGSSEFNYFDGPYDQKIEVMPGQLLFAWSGSRGTSFGPHIWTGPKGLLNYHTWKIEVRETAINPAFFFHALKLLTQFIEERAHGASALVHTQKWEMEGFFFPAPENPNEQRAIATALSDVDALLEELDRLIAKKRDLKQAAMQQLLTGQTRLPGFEGEWEIKTLGELLERLANGAVYKPGGHYGVPITRIETIASGYIDHERVGSAIFDKSLNNYRLQSGDIIFSHINSVDHIGKVALVSEKDLPLYHGMNLLLIRTSSLCNPYFLFYWLESERSRKKMRTLAKQAVSQASINTSELRQVEILLPNLAEQTAIVAALSGIDTEMEALQQRRAKSAALKQAMMQELLTGRTRLV